jgi:hypothetical protein
VHSYVQESTYYTISSFKLVFICTRTVLTYSADSTPALLQHARAQSDGYRQQAGTLGWGPAEWARHAAAATYTSTGEPGAAGAPALELVHSCEYLPPELMQSLAACIGADIAVLTRDMATGDIK